MKNMTKQQLRNKIADDIILRISNSFDRGEFSDAITFNDLEEFIKKDKEYAEEVRSGLHDDNPMLWGRVRKGDK